MSRDASALGPPSTGGRVVSLLALGAAVALAGWMRPWVVFPVLALLTLVCLPAVVRLGREIRSAFRGPGDDVDPRLRAAVLTLLAFCFLTCLLWALADEVGYDSML